ncbi:MAG: glycerophosphodiester phosphodiesterase [Gammaproteobacteria bacterium]|nr:glycerophosphodiester phosphodiesterase [Gammaproteobacteria bacterium]
MQHLIAHRGEPEHWPENTLLGFRTVLAAGAAFVETDVQLSADGVPVLCHDASLLRTTGCDLDVCATPLAELQALSAGEQGRFGERFANEPLALLSDFTALLTQWPDRRAFVEIKAASIEAFGIVKTVDTVLSALGAAFAQCIPISFDHRAISEVRLRADLPVGWVLPEWNDGNRQLAEALAPEYLFVDQRRLPTLARPLWPGPWRWVAYTVNDIEQVERLLAMGFDLVETNDFRHLAQVINASV